MKEPGKARYKRHSRPDLDEVHLEGGYGRHFERSHLEKRPPGAHILRMVDKAPSPFSVRTSTAGTGFIVVYSPERAPQMEIRQTFETEAEGYQWIASNGEMWLDRLGQGR